MKRQTKRKLLKAGGNASASAFAGFLVLAVIMTLAGGLLALAFVALLFAVARSGSSGARLVLGAIALVVFFQLLESRPYILAVMLGAFILMALSVMYFGRRKA